MRNKPEIAEALDERAMPRVSEDAASEGYIRGEKEEKSTQREDAAAGKGLTSEQMNDTLRKPIVRYKTGDVLPRIPEYENANIPPAKLYEYSLNMNHNRGRNKAIVFQSALGFNSGNGELLKQAILSGLAVTPAKVGYLTEYGQTFVVDMPITGPNGNTAIVRTAWIIRPDKDYPDLVSAYVK